MLAVAPYCVAYDMMNYDWEERRKKTCVTTIVLIWCVGMTTKHFFFFAFVQKIKNLNFVLYWALFSFSIRWCRCDSCSIKWLWFNNKCVNTRTKKRITIQSQDYTHWMYFCKVLLFIWITIAMHKFCLLYTKL